MNLLKRYIFGEVRDGRLSVDEAQVLLAEAAAAPVAAAPAAARPVAVIGMAGRFPQADDVGEFWARLLAGTDCVTEVPPSRWPLEGFYSADAATARAAGLSCSKWGGFLRDIEHFDFEFFGIGADEARHIGPKELLFVEVAWRTLESAGYSRESLKAACAPAGSVPPARGPASVGVFVGTVPGTHHHFGPGSESNAPVPSLASSTLPNRVSRLLDLSGPSLAVDTHSSSSLTALHLACESLQRGECRMALAGGITLLYPELFAYLTRFGLLATRPDSRSFSAGDGFLLAEAAGAVLLRPLADALAAGDNVLAVIRGTAARHAGQMGPHLLPSMAAQAEVMEEALRRAGVEPASIGCVESAANGAALGDAIELAALNRVLGPRDAGLPRVRVSSVKSVLGHAEAASGMTQLAKAVMQLREGVIAPGSRPAQLNDSLRLGSLPFDLPDAPAEWAPDPDATGRPCRRLLLNSFGAGGSYASAVLEAHEPADAVAAGAAGGRQLVVLSARNMDRLKATQRRLADFVRSREGFDLADLAFTLQQGREAMPFRWATVVGSRDELLRALAVDPSPVHDATAHEGLPPLHVGNAGDHQAELGRWLDERAQQELLQRYVDEGDLDRVAACWVNGVRVPWAALHVGRTPRRMELPGYPFQRVCIHPVNPAPRDEPFDNRSVA